MRVNINKLDSLVFLRGIAVIMICFCHFGYALSSNNIFAPIFENFHKYGLYGVHIFFVISGFVIPLSLFNGKYQIRNYPRFLYKRLLRLHPPYLAALILTLIVMLFSYKGRHILFPETTRTILQSLIYFHVPADNPVFWTLKVEMQYYLLIGLLFSTIVRYPVMAIFIFIPVVIGLSQTTITHYILLFTYLEFFFIGTVGFLMYKNIGSRFLNVTALIILLLFSAISEIPACICAFLTIAGILTYRSAIPLILQFPGKISYSVYLIHFLIGVKFINLIKPKIDLSYSWLLFTATLVIVFAISWLFYQIFESFSEKLSKKIKYNGVTKYAYAIAQEPADENQKMRIK